MTALRAVSESFPCSPYYFVHLDEAGYCLSEGPLLLEGDDDAISHARDILDGAMLVAVYRDGHRVSTLAKLC
ncbi:MAG: hypothetical protein ACXU82_18640 [Caulobacteraceae bacterium]